MMGRCTGGFTERRKGACEGRSGAPLGGEHVGRGGELPAAQCLQTQTLAVLPGTSPLLSFKVGKNRTSAKYWEEKKK